MELEAEVKKEHFLEFYKNASKSVLNVRSLNTKFKIFSIFIWILFGVGSVAVYKLYDSNNECCLNNLNIAVICFLAWLVAMTALLTWYRNAYLDRVVDESGATLGIKSFKLDKDGVTEIGEKFTSSFRWDLIRGVEKGKTCVYLYIDAGSAVLIPHEKLSGYELEELAATIQEYSAYEL